MKSNNEKCICNLENKGIYSKEENGTVYIAIGDSYYELSEFEINFQANEYCNNK